MDLDQSHVEWLAKGGLTTAALTISYVLGRILLNDRTRMIARLETLENHLRDTYVRVIEQNSVAMNGHSTTINGLVEFMKNAKCPDCAGRESKEKK